MSGLAYKARGAGRPIVFLHGLGGGAENWNPQLADLGEDFRAIAVDLPGYGASPVTGPQTMAGWADALAGLIHALDFGPVALCGHSLGGMLAQEMMIDHTDKVSHLILSCTSSVFGSRDGSFQQAFLADRLKPLEAGGSMRDVAEQNAPGLFSPSADPHLVDLMTASTMSLPEETYRASLDILVGFNRRDELAAIEVPTLAIAAEHDRAAPEKGVRRMAETLKNGSFRLIEGSGHMPNLEAAATFNAAIRGFLAN